REYQRLLRSKQNIVLCGMPSCGKTTVGKALAGSCGRRFVDTDEVIVLQAGMEIPEIFAREGEAGFRARETAAIESLAAEQGLVIATGGGAVLKDENIRLLRHNGLLCFLERNPMLLEPGSGRPLSGSREALMSLYERRLPRYRQVADITISNDGAPGQAVEELEKYVS
ncbi:MAG: shikimate kinase, partial [Bacteroidales bacterium]|nr:shikimate kinase [Bacteroidales bacterium]